VALYHPKDRNSIAACYNAGMSEFAAKHGTRWLPALLVLAALVAARMNLLGVGTLFRDYGRGLVGVMAAFFFVVAMLLLSTVGEKRRPHDRRA
jgi:hypothetical protein